MRATRCLAVLVLSLVVSACGGRDSTTPGSSGSGPVGTNAVARPPGTIKVPADQPTIQKAVDAAVPGDLILISPGVYQETVTVETPRLVLRGLDRAGVVIDGERKRDNGIKAFADGIVIENLTVKNHAANGIFVSGDTGGDSGSYGSGSGGGGRQLVGFRLSYITALANDLYGVYSFAAQDGSFDHIYASGSGDAGVYVGRCDPCNTVVTDVLAEHNAIGFEGTNASVGLVVTRSIWRANRVGITSNSQKLEKKAPQHDAIIVGNLVDGAGAEISPTQANGAFGLGIAIGGGRQDQVTRNRVINNQAAGIVVTDLDGFVPQSVSIIENVLTGNAVDISAYHSKVDLPAGAVCIKGNTAERISPPDIPVCGVGVGGVIDLVQPGFPNGPAGVRPDKLPAPPTLEQLPDAATAPARPATDGAPKIDVSTIPVPPAA